GPPQVPRARMNPEPRKKQESGCDRPDNSAYRVCEVEATCTACDKRLGLLYERVGKREADAHQDRRNAAKQQRWSAAEPDLRERRCRARRDTHRSFEWLGGGEEEPRDCAY